MFRLLWVLVVSSASSAVFAMQAPADGRALMQAGKTLEACEAFEAVLDKDPGNVQARAGEIAASERLALEARAAGRMDDALRSLLQAEQYVPDDTKLLYDLGVLEDEMRLYADADKTLARLESLSPHEPNVLYAAARVKLDLGQLAQAEQRMLAYLTMRPNDASAHYGLGRVYQLELQFDKARGEFERSIALKPVQTESYYEMGEVALGQGSLVEAMADYRKTLARDPKHGGALVGMGRVCFEQKQYAQAESYLKQAVAAAPEYQAGHYYLGLTLAREGRKEDSQRELALATQLAAEQSKRDRGLRLNPASTHMQ